MYGQEVMVGSKKIRKGDRVVVIAGNAKGQKGNIIACLGNRVVVGGVKKYKHHVKQLKEHPEGGRIEFESPIHISNVRACDEEGRPLELKQESGARPG